MSNRYADWFRQAEADLKHARNSLEHGDFEWSCFAAHQAAEKAINGFESGAPTDFILPKKPEMLFTRRRRSLNSVAIKSIDRDQIRKAVASFAAQIRKQHPEVERIIWFGSWVNGLPTPGSDVDLCLILSSSDKPPRDRIPDYLPLGFPVGIDLFAYTKNEFERLRHSSPGWYQAIISGLEI